MRTYTIFSRSPKVSSNTFVIQPVLEIKIHFRSHPTPPTEDNVTWPKVQLLERSCLARPEPLITEYLKTLKMGLGTLEMTKNVLIR